MKYRLPPSSSIESRNSQLVPTDGPTLSQNDAHVFFDSRVYNYIPNNPTQFPELGVWEAYFFNLMKDISAPSPLDKLGWPKTPRDPPSVLCAVSSLSATGLE